MNRGVNGLLMAGLIILMMGCTSVDGEKYVLGEKIYIKYLGTAEHGDWIKIDGITFMHLEPDTTGQSTNPEFDFKIISEDTINKYPGVFALPVTNIFDNVGGSGNWARSQNSEAELAKELVSQINFANYDESDILMEKLTYGYEGNQLTMAAGEIVMYRKDGAKIKVSSSDGYPAYIGKESHTDYLKKMRERK
jgi:hypothetical protein